MDRQGCEKMETPNQTKRKPNLRKQGQVPEGSAFPLHPGFASLRPLLLPRSALRALTCPAPAPRLPRQRAPWGRRAACSPWPLTARAPGEPARKRGTRHRDWTADAPHTSPRRTQVTAVWAQGRLRPQCRSSGRRTRAAAGASAPGSCPESPSPRALASRRGSPTHLCAPSAHPGELATGPRCSQQ